VIATARVYPFESLLENCVDRLHRKMTLSRNNDRIVSLMLSEIPHLTPAPDLSYQGKDEGMEHVRSFTVRFSLMKGTGR